MALSIHMHKDEDPDLHVASAPCLILWLGDMDTENNLKSRVMTLVINTNGPTWTPGVRF